MLLAVEWTDSSLRRLEFRGGITRAIGWVVACLTTEEFGFRRPDVIFIFAIAVLIEAVGLYWCEKYNRANNEKSLFRCVSIFFECFISLVLLGLYLLTLSKAVSIAIGGNQLFHTENPIFCLSLPLWFYFLLYFAPAYCAASWAMRAYILEKIIKRKTLA